MPPKRRASGPATKSQQSTLAFHGASNKVTKSGVKAQGAKKSLLATKLKDFKPEIIDVSDTEPTTTAEAAIIEQTEQEVKAQQVESTPEEDQARRISDAAIKKYWAAKEKERSTPRVHQQSLGLHDKVLREFDMSSHYGVSLPISGGHHINTLACCDFC
jgi:DNA polymerase delta subunit 4